jgi:hypothetical protein
MEMNDIAEQSQEVNIEPAQDKDLTDHLNRLRGEVAKGELVYINGHYCKALTDFNTYMTYPNMKALAKEYGKAFCTSMSYPSMLASEGIIALLDTPKHPFQDVPSYTQYPYSVSIEDVLKVMMIFTVELGDKAMYSFSIRDVYIYSKMKAFAKAQRYDTTLTHLENLKRVIASLEQEYMANIHAYE